ncbi:hypothetical protein FB562_1748 [Homoserinimonas aerilata]|uniref:Dolichyl-phosphate-mannose-protein mannosyltransferase n=1 Tax=Homoserinimonas aerilata TaxID=1162970 RepID=A0A542YKP2_9MICO|nr:hypothetical protein [Homoserinimonas aerilata]TQL48650.1 hypothetical protein FB562_1748 [Homoserinimonas aerilata]
MKLFRRARPELSNATAVETSDGRLLGTDRTPATGFRGWVKQFWVTIVLVLVALAMCVSNLAQHSHQFSPYDEWVYYDYITKVPSQLYVHQGEYIGEDALSMMACFGDGFGARGEPCTGLDGVYDEPEVYPQEGKTSADPYTPAYFATTWAVASVAHFVTGVDMLTTSRAVSALWLAGGLIVLTMFLREFRLRPILILGLGLSYIGLVTTFYASTFISTDAPSLLAGATLGLLAVRFAKTGRHAPWLAIASAIAVWLKITNIFAVGIVVVALLVHAFFRHRAGDHAPHPSPRRMGVVSAVVAAIAIAAELIWLVIWKASSIGEGPDQGISIDLTPQAVIASLFTFLLPRDGVGPDISWVAIMQAPYSAMLVAGIIGWFFAERRDDMNRAWSIAVIISATLFAPALMIALQLLLGEVAPVIPRYTLGMAPMMLLAIGMIARNNIAAWIVLGYGIAVSTFSVIGLYG